MEEVSGNGEELNALEQKAERLTEDEEAAAGV